jgi:hypothetical protein
MTAPPPITKHRLGCDPVEIDQVPDRDPVRTIEAGNLKVMDSAIVGRRIADLDAIQEQLRRQGDPGAGDNAGAESRRAKAG